MKLNSGERVLQEAQFECVQCRARILVNAGQMLPDCPECAGSDFRLAEDFPTTIVIGCYEWQRLHDLRQS